MANMTTTALKTQLNQSTVPSQTVMHRLVDRGMDTYTDVQAILDTTDTFDAGDKIRTKDGYLYQVAASGASDHHLTTAGSVKLYVLPINGQIHVNAFGADPTGVEDSTDAFNKAMQYAVANKVPGNSSGVYKMTGTLTPGGRYAWNWGDTELNYVSADPGDLTVIKYNPQGSSSPEDSSNVVAFDTKGATQSVNMGMLAMVGATVSNMKFASRANIPSNVVAISASESSSADMTWGTVNLRGFGYGFWQGDQRGTAPNILPYTRWAFNYLKIERCIVAFESGQSGNGMDDMNIGEMRITRCSGTSRLRGTDLGGGTLFNNGLNPAEDQEAETISVTASSTAATLSADTNANIIVGRHLIIEDAGADKAGNPIWFVAKVAAKTGTSITLDRAPERTVSGAKILLDGPSMVLTSSHMRMQQVYNEECHTVPMQLDGLSTISGVIKASAGDCSSYAFGVPIVLGNQAKADVVLHAKTALTADVGAHIGIVSAKDGSNVFSSGAVRVSSCGTYANLSAAVDPVKLISFYDGNAGSGSIYALGDHNPNVRMEVSCADGDYVLRNYGTVAKPAYKMPLELGTPAIITATTNSGGFGSPAGGSSVKTSGSTGYLYHTVTAGKRYRVVVALSVRSGGAPELRWHNGGTLLEAMCKCGYSVGRFVMYGDAPASTTQLRLFGYSADDYTVSEFTIAEVLSV